MYKNIPLVLLLALWSHTQVSAESAPHHQKLLAEVNKNTQAVWGKDLKKAGAAADKVGKLLPSQAEKADNSQLAKLLAKDINREGLLMSIVGALTLLYRAISDALLYPIFALLFFLQTILLIFLGIQMIRKYRKGDFLSHRRLLFMMGLLILIYFDLFLVVYEQHKILLLGLTLQKDIVMILLATFLGFIRGKYMTKREFEEKVLP